MLNKKNIICTFLLALLCSLGVKAQVIDGAKVTPFTFARTTDYFTALSDNGQWAVVSGTDSENTTLYGYAQLVNTTTGKITQLWPEGETGLGYTASDVSDDGKMVLGSSPAGAGYYDVDKKAWVALPGGGSANAMTPDGKRIVGERGTGEIDNYGQSLTEAVIWDRQADGSYVCKTARELYPKFPVRDKNNVICAMFSITGVSADGNILVGATNFVYLGENGSYVFNCTTGETIYPEQLMPEGVNVTPTYVDNAKLSNDGTHLTGHAYTVFTSGAEYVAAFDMNVTNKTLDLYYQYSDEQDRGGGVVTNNGMVIASSPAVNPVRYLYVRYGKLWFGLDEIMTGRYGINIYDAINQESTGYILGISNDEKVLLCMSSPTGSGYIIRLPETLTEAASHINPYAEGSYALTPAAGASFSRFKSGTLKFSKPTTMKSQATFLMLKPDGTTLFTGSIVPLSDGTSFTLSGSTRYKLNPGEDYTLYIPAGTFSLSADDSYQNDDIRIKYKGREEKPVAVVAKSPDNDANVSEISTDQPVRIQFDMDVQVATDKEGNAAVGKLYEGDNETPVCDLTITTNGTMVGLAPALRRYLRSGFDYRVVLPAGSVTDIMGYCANEEIELTYHGQFVPEPDASGDLFSDDFNDPSWSMGTYLLYEGDHLTPAAEPAGWEFDKDNNPWNFTLRDDESSTDYYAASHSMYNPAGQSDDWMSIPQLFIENGDYYLNFDAQSYKSNKNDVLKVVVLATDEGYTSFTDELYNKFKTEGKTIFEEKLSFGASQDLVSSDWVEGTNYEISLAEFAGKYVYIAFVNQNEDQSAIFLDNIRVYYRGDFLLTDNTEDAVVKQGSIKVAAQVNITGDDTYNDITATVKAGDWTSTFTETGLGLTKDSPAFQFEFPEEMPLVEGEENKYTITVNVDGNQFSREGSVKNLMFETKKRVVVEKITGQPCGYCPGGIIASDYIEQLFGDDYIPVEIHSTAMGEDAYAYDNYANYFNPEGIPAGLVNRLNKTVYQPLAVIDGIYSYNGDGKSSTTWLDLVQEEFENNPVADADINVTKANVNTATRQIEIEGNVNYAVNLNSVNQNILFVVVENGLTGTQHNYYQQRGYANQTILSEWHAMDEYVSWTYNHVARRVVDDLYTGISGLIPVSVEADNAIPFSLTRSAYDNVTNWWNAELVAMLIDNNTGRIVNAVKAPFTVDGSTGINSVATDNGEGIAIAVNGGDVNVNAAGNVTVTVYNVNGSLVGMADGEGSVNVPTNGKGLYIVKAKAGDASVVKKVVVR